MVSPSALSAQEKALLKKAREKLSEGIGLAAEAFETIGEEECGSSVPREEAVEAYGAIYHPVEMVLAQLKQVERYEEERLRRLRSAKAEVRKLEAAA